MSFIASIILRDRIIQVSDSRVVSEAGENIIIESDTAQKVFQLKNDIGMAYCGVLGYGSMTLERALESFKITESLNLPPVQLADRLRDHLAGYWGSIGKGVFCFHIGGYYQGRPFGFARYNPIRPIHLENNVHAPWRPWVLEFIGDDMEAIPRALDGMRVPQFSQVSPVQTLNFMVDMVHRVIKGVPSCGGDVRVHIITPDRITDFRVTRTSPKIFPV